jgi:hypothetical protein
MAVNPHENIGHANDKAPLSPFESAPKTPEKISFAAVMTDAPAIILSGKQSVFSKFEDTKGAPQKDSKDLDIPPLNYGSFDKSAATPKFDAQIAAVIDDKQLSNLDTQKDNPPLNWNNPTALNWKTDSQWQLTA